MLYICNRHVLNMLFANLCRKFVYVISNHLSQNLENHNHVTSFLVREKDLFSNIPAESALIIESLKFKNDKVHDIAMNLLLMLNLPHVVS